MSQLPASWAVATLRVLGSWTGGGTPSKSIARFWSGTIPWVSPKDMKVARIKDTEDHITNEAIDKSAASLVPCGSVLIVTRSGILRHSLPVAVTDVDVAVNQDLKALTVADGVCPDYVAWALRRFGRTVLSTCAKSGTTVQNLETTRLLDFEIPLAPSAEQRRIVAAIEEHFSRLESAETALRRVQSRVELFRSSVTSLVEGNWPRRTWKEIARSQNGRAFPSRDYANEGVKLLRPGNLHASGRVVWTQENTRHLPVRYEEAFPSYIVGPHELVMNLTAQSLKDEFLGRVCLTGPDDHCLLNQRLARLTPSEAVNARYPLYVLKARPFRRFVASLNKGSLIQHMFTSQLDEFEVPVPPLEEQRRIVDQIEQQLSTIESLEAKIDTGLRRSLALRHSILEQAFLGKLVPHDPFDEPASVLFERIAAEHARRPRPSRRNREVPA